MDVFEIRPVEVCAPADLDGAELEPSGLPSGERETERQIWIIAEVMQSTDRMRFLHVLVRGASSS